MNTETFTFAGQSITATPESIQTAREWIMDNDWADLEAEDVTTLSSRSVVIGIRSFYEGGWQQFMIDNA